MRRFGVWRVLTIVLSILATEAVHGATTVVLVRHAEKAAQVGHEDPILTEAGLARAAELVRVLASAEIVAIYSSPYARTLGTIRPLAEARELEILERNPRAADDLAAEIRTEYEDGVVVVSGHSNTVPDIARALGVETDLAYTEQDYDDILILTLHDDGTATMLHLHYGAKSD